MRGIDTERAKSIAIKPTMPVRSPYQVFPRDSIDSCLEDERSIANKLADAGKVNLVVMPNTHVDLLGSTRIRKSRRAERLRNLRRTQRFQ